MNEEPKPCACTGPGQCQRAGRLMAQRDFEICSGMCPPERQANCTPEMSVAMRRLWDSGQLQTSVARKRLPPRDTKEKRCVHLGDLARDPPKKGRKLGRPKRRDVKH